MILSRKFEVVTKHATLVGDVKFDLSVNDGGDVVARVADVIVWTIHTWDERHTRKGHEEWFALADTIAEGLIDPIKLLVGKL